MHCPFWLLQNMDSRNQTEVLILASLVILGPEPTSFLIELVKETEIIPLLRLLLIGSSQS